MPDAGPTLEQLEKLRDIHLPNPIGFWPPAVGWWLLVIVTLILSIALLIWLVNRHSRRLYRRQALGQLLLLLRRYRADGDALAYLTNASDLIKRVAIASFGRTACASLVGEDWMKFLDSTGRTEEFSSGGGLVMMSGQYREDTSPDPEVLHRLICRWVRQHRTRLPDASGAGD